MVSNFKWDDPDWRSKRQSEVSLQHQDPDFVLKLREGQNRPEVRSKKSQSLKEAFQDPEVKERHRLGMLKDRTCASCGNPFIGAAAARRCPECRLANELVNKWKIVAQLVARDGISCSLCGVDVDLFVPGNTTWGASIDHRIPSGVGGTNEFENLGLAHFECNRKKSTKW